MDLFTSSRRHVAVSLFASLGLLASAGAQVDAAAAEAAWRASERWQQFEQDAGGIWRVQWHAATGTPAAIWGSGLHLPDWRENSLAEARRHADRLLRERAALLGLGASDFRESIGARMGRTWTFTYDQYFRGLRAVGGRADVRVNMSGRIAMFGARAWPIPADFGVTPAITPEAATASAWRRVGTPSLAPQPAPVAAPELVIYGDIEAAAQVEPALCWEVAVSNVDETGDGPIGRWYVDAMTGEPLRFVSDKHECGIAGCDRGVDAAGHGAAPAAAPLPELPPINTTVTVMGWTRTGVDGYSALTNAPLPGLVLSVPGIGSVTTDNNGQFTINISSPVAITVGAFDGRHHAVMTGADAPGATVTVTPGVATTIQLLTSAATTNQAAHTTTTYWTDRVNEWARSILGNTPQLATASNVGVAVNIASTCNAYYTNNTTNYYQAGGGCSNTSTATIVAHEWGHGIDDRYGGISQTNGLSEGWGDILGMYLCDTPNLGSGFQTANVPLRSGNNTTQYPATGGVHTQGQSWMGFAWKLRERLATTLGNRPAAIALTDDIVISTLAANATNQADAVLQVYLADDDDGNLVNGTPHMAELDFACNLHSLPIPVPTPPLYGAGCYDRSRAFYELFPSSAFDLANSAMRLTYTSPGYYVASAAGAYVAPTAAATTLVLTDDSSTPVTLASSFPYPGGTTSTLEVCSNGFVSVAAGNGTSYTPSASTWLASAQARWGCWHDYNPGAAGSGTVKFEQVGSISYVTWDGVYSFGTTSPATFQLQLNRSNGNVTYAWGPVTVAGNGWLVGFAAAAPNRDAGNRDLSATLGATFQTSTANQAPLQLNGGFPRLGQTLTLTTTNFGANTVGLQILSPTRVDPGIELGFIGMPDCFQYTGSTVLETLTASNGTAAYSLAVPNNPALINFQFVAQSLAVAPGVNAAGLVTSNGIALTVVQ